MSAAQPPWDDSGRGGDNAFPPDMFRDLACVTENVSVPVFLSVLLQFERLKAILHGVFPGSREIELARGPSFSALGGLL